MKCECGFRSIKCAECGTEYVNYILDLRIRYAEAIQKLSEVGVDTEKFEAEMQDIFSMFDAIGEEE